MDAHPHSPHEAPHTIHNPLARLALIALLILAGLGCDPAAAIGPPASFYVESTGHILADPFLRHWVEHDGEQLLGMPVTDVVELGEQTEQYFQYGVLIHRSNGGISRRIAGSALLGAHNSDQALVSELRDPSARTVHGVPADDVVHQTVDIPTFEIDPELLPYWQQWGGAAFLGNPISVMYQDRGTRTQWFEYGRIDLGPDGAILAEVGLELALLEGMPTDPADRGNLPLFDPSRFVDFAGDGTIPNADEPFDPVRLQIPKIKVDAGIEITTVQDGVMTNPVDPWKAGWYQSFSRPGEWSNTVIAGHRDWYGYGPVVFWDLGWLQPGDKIYLAGKDGRGATYVVGAVEVVPSSVDPQTIINDVGYEALTLITCGGVWTGTEYTQRIIIRAYRI